MRVFRVISILLVSLLALAVLWITGPREPVELAVAIDEEAIAADPVAYLEAEEAAVPGVNERHRKEIVWAFPQSRAKTPLAIVYAHGFSASRNEIEPVVSDAAERLGANAFFMRLAGHGRDGAAMGGVSVNDWINDMAEALAVAEQIGERTVVIGTSTGASLAALATLEPGMRERIDALVQISPNYGLADRRAAVLDFPFAEDIVRLVEGEERGFEPVSELHGTEWTTRYPTRAVVVMAALTRELRGRTFENAAVPTLFVFDEEDRVVDSASTRRVAGRWGRATGARVNIETVSGVEDPYRHVIAGDALSPAMTGPITDMIVHWIESLPFAGGGRDHTGASLPAEPEG